MSTFGLFNEKWYLDQNPDVAAAVTAGWFTAYQHFELYGKNEGRAPGPLFDVQGYLDANPDVAAAVGAGVMSAYGHFVQYGASEGRSPLQAFDVDFYLAQNPDVAAAVDAGQMSAIQHLLLYGRAENRSIMVAVDLGAYLDANPDVKAAAENAIVTPLDHLLNFGLYEERSLGNGIELTMFASDPAYTQALATGNLDTALARLSAVAPFVPGFERPQGWTPAPDTPIPVDFVPRANMKLIVPPEVRVPDGLTLPDTFEQKPAGGGSILEVNDSQTFTAAELHELTVIGTGSVTVTASEGSQTLRIGTTGINDITGGTGSDHIILGMGTGTDTIHIHAHAPVLMPGTRIETIEASGEDAAVFGQVEIDVTGVTSGVVYFRLEGETATTTHRYSGLTLEQIVDAINTDDTMNMRVVASVKEDGGSVLVLTSVDPARSLDGGLTDITHAFSDSYPGVQFRDLIRNFQEGTDILSLSDDEASGLVAAPLTLDDIADRYKGIGNDVGESWIAGIDNGVVTFGGVLGATIQGSQSAKVSFLYEAVGNSKGTLAFNDQESQGVRQGKDLAVVMQFDGIRGSTQGDSLIALVGDQDPNADGFAITDLNAVLGLPV